MRRKADKSHLMPLLAPPAVFAVLLAVSGFDLFQRFESVTVDWRFRSRSAWDPPADSRVLLLGIGEHSLQTFGRWEEWTRLIHVEFLKRLSLRPPKVVAYDFLFTETARDSAHDFAFADELAIFPGAVTGAALDETRAGLSAHSDSRIGKTRPITRVSGELGGIIEAPNGLLPLTSVAESSWTGFVDAPSSERDGIRRRLPLVVRLGDDVYPSFVLQILMQFEGAGSDDVEVIPGEAIVIQRADGGERRVPIDESGMLTLNYRNLESLEAFDYAGIMDLLEQFDETGQWPPSVPPLEGKIVIIGQMAEGLTDFGPTPLSPRSPLVQLHAVAVSNILQDDYLTVIPVRPVLFAWFVLAWTTLWWVRRTPSVAWSISLPAALALAYFAFAWFAFRAWSVQLPVILPLLGFLLVHAGSIMDHLVSEIRARRRIKGLFGTYVSPEIVERMVELGEDPELGGRTSEITAFFSDVQGFTTLAEQLGPEDLVTVMYEYLSEVTEVLVREGGTLDKYIGDAVVGMFGAPLPAPNHAYHACRAAIDIQLRQAELRERWSADGKWPATVLQMRTRIGLNTGEAVIGNMGSFHRFNYTMMGDTVNLAARCESGAKHYGVYTMVTGETRKAAERAGRDIVYRYLDRIVVKGRSLPVETHEVVGRVGDLPPGVSTCIEAYDGGIASYLARDWDAAMGQFETFSALERFHPGRDAGVSTNPSLVMMERCAEMKRTPPGEDWDGSHVMREK